MDFIYHITTPELWQAALAAGEYRAPTLAAEGFMHASTAEQLVGSANRFYSQQPSVLLLKIRLDRVRPPVVWEQSTHSANPFPHLYGPLNLDAVVRLISWDRGSDGAYFAPADLESPA